MAKARVITTDADIHAAIAGAKAEPDDGPLAVSAKYIMKLDLFVVNLTDGSRVVLQREKLQGLEKATGAQLSEVEVLALGTNLRWKDLDVDLYVPALIAGIFGTKQWMVQLGRSGGKVTSDAKAHAARTNGLKGGRPPKRLTNG